MNKKLLIFDLDGTLVDTIQDIASAVNMMLEHYGLPLHSVECVRKMVGRGAKNLITQALPEDKRNSAFCDEALEYYRSCYDNNLVVKTRVYDGLKDVLVSLKNQGVKMAVNSNKDDRHVKEIINKLLPDIFMSVNGFSVEYPHKPSPESTLAIMRKFEAEQNETAFVGDSAVDILTARNAGITAVGVLWGFGGAESFSEASPDVLVTLPNELLNI